MKDDYRETPSGKTVKYDSDPTNDYSDGYNAGRRYETPEPPKKTPWWLWLLLLLPLLIFLLWFASLQAWPGDGAKSKTTPTVTPSAAPGAVPGATPAPGSSPTTHGVTPNPTPAMLPATGRD